MGPNLPWFKLIFFLPGNGKDFENEFLLKKNIIWDATLPTPRPESFRFRTDNYVV